MEENKKSLRMIYTIIAVMTTIIVGTMVICLFLIKDDNNAACIATIVGGAIGGIGTLIAIIFTTRQAHKQSELTIDSIKQNKISLQQNEQALKVSQEQNELSNKQLRLTKYEKLMREYKELVNKKEVLQYKRKVGMHVDGDDLTLIEENLKAMERLIKPVIYEKNDRRYERFTPILELGARIYFE